MFKITNRNKFDFVGRYDGVNYAFPAGGSVCCPEDAARHIFGIGETDKTAVFARHGWVTLSGQFADGVRILSNFVFDDVSPKLDAPLASDLALSMPATGAYSGSAVGQSMIDYGPAPVVGDGGEATAADAADRPPPVNDPGRQRPAAAGEPAETIAGPLAYTIEKNIPIPAPRR